MPRVSIGLPVYNGEEFLDETLESLVTQSYGDLEIIIADNASTDGTAEICQRYVQADPRVSYYRNPTNTGGGPNANEVFTKARGEYFKWASHDDVCAPKFVERCVEALDRDPAAVLAFPQMVDIDAEGKPLPPPIRSKFSRAERAASGKPHIRFRNLIRTDSLCEEVFGLIRTDVLRKTPLFRNYTDSDRTLLVELAMHGRFVEVPELLFYHRIHRGMSGYPILPGTDFSSIRAMHDAWQSRTVWFDPKWEGRAVSPLTWQFRDYIEIIRGSSMRSHERTICLLALQTWLARKWVFLLLELHDRRREAKWTARNSVLSRGGNS
jgi:glycosyltransferase involved in cell wall biosynthesis